MKRLFLSMMAMAAITTTLTLTSCGSDDDGNDTPDGASILAADGKTLMGNLTGKQTLEEGEYILGGTVIIENGGELTIPAGTMIKATKGFSSYILVVQGGKLYANGTSSQPVTFTSGEATKKAGDWGGIILNGKAPISGAGAEGTNTANAEINNAYKYGGSDRADNSGALTYVNILYAGARNTADIEHNGLTLNGVGNGTKIQNVYVLESADDAIEFFGGTVNVTNLLAVNPDDDMFDFTQGYKGTLSNCYGIWEDGYTSTEEDPRGVEADGNLDGNGVDHVGQSDFIIDGMTIVNNTVGGNTTTGQKNAMDDVIKVRRGATATIKNTLVASTSADVLKAKDLVDVTDSKGGGTVTINITTSSFSYTNEKVVDYVDKTNPDKNVVGQGTITLTNPSASNAGANTSVFAWTNYSFPTLN